MLLASTRARAGREVQIAIAGNGQPAQSTRRRGQTLGIRYLEFIGVVPDFGIIARGVFQPGFGDSRKRRTHFAIRRYVEELTVEDDDQTESVGCDTANTGRLARITAEDVGTTT
jgi:hypothetical protein